MLRSGAEVAGVELVGGTDLARGNDRRMERGRNGRREYIGGRRGGGRDPSREQGPANAADRAGDADSGTRAESIPRTGDAGGVCLDGCTMNRSITASKPRIKIKKIQQRKTPVKKSEKTNNNLNQL
jgi:hypothetical protein